MLRWGLSSAQRDEAQAIGCSRGGRTTKCNGVCDEHGRLRRFRLTAGGQRNEMVAALELVEEIPPEASARIADKAYDSNELRAWLIEQRLTPVIPQREIGQRPADHPELYKERNWIERAFNRLKDYRRFSTRFDKLANTFEATIALIATRIWFLGGV